MTNERSARISITLTGIGEKAHSIGNHADDLTRAIAEIPSTLGISRHVVIEDTIVTPSPVSPSVLEDNGRLLLRPSSDPKVLSAQLKQSLILESPPAEMKRYKGYLAQIIRDCIIAAVRTGDLQAPRNALNIMSAALHQVERIRDVEPEVARDVWMVQWFLEVAQEALQDLDPFDPVKALVLKGEEMAWLTRILTGLPVTNQDDDHMRKVVLNKLIG